MKISDMEYVRVQNGDFSTMLSLEPDAVQAEAGGSQPRDQLGYKLDSVSKKENKKTGGEKA